MTQNPLRRMRALGSAALALSGLGVAVGAIVASGGGELAAATNTGRRDLDGDGLSDAQELVLGTRPDQADTDLDGFSDLEERARGSNPLLASSLPSAAGLTVGTVACLEGEMVSILSAIYVNDASANTTDVRVGIVHRGRPFYLRAGSFQNARGFLRSGSDLKDSLGVVEVAVPQSLVRQLGQLNLFAAVRSSVPGAGVAVSVLPLVDVAGVTVVAESPAMTYVSNGGGSPSTGVQYRPLVPDRNLPVGWSSGQMCAQVTNPIGIEGVSVVHQVDAAECQAMDTYCNPTECQASIGTTLALPDPAALAGG